jgi:RecA-family ATPase
MQLAACIASGHPFLGRETLQGKVLFFSAEDDEEELRYRLAQIADQMKIKADALANVELRSSIDLGVSPVLISNHGYTPLYRSLIDYCARHKPTFVILDTLSAICSLKSNDNDGATRLINSIQTEFGTTVQILHHLRKQNQNDKSERPTIDDVRDSSALIASVRSTIILHDNIMTLDKCNGRHRTSSPIKKSDQFVMHIEQGCWTLDKFVDSLKGEHVGVSGETRMKSIKVKVAVTDETIDNKTMPKEKETKFEKKYNKQIFHNPIG